MYKVFNKTEASTISCCFHVDVEIYEPEDFDFELGKPKK
jgi:hypothetical protein